MKLLLFNYRADLRRDTSTSDYLILMNADVDAFLNRDGSQPEELAEGGIPHLELTEGATMSDMGLIESTMPEVVGGDHELPSSLHPELSHETTDNKVSSNVSLPPGVKKQNKYSTAYCITPARLCNSCVL